MYLSIVECENPSKEPTFLREPYSAYKIIIILSVSFKCSHFGAISSNLSSKSVNNPKSSW